MVRCIDIDIFKLSIETEKLLSIDRISNHVLSILASKLYLLMLCFYFLFRLIKYIIKCLSSYSFKHKYSKIFKFRYETRSTL